MKHVFDRLSKLALAVLWIALGALLMGVPFKLVGVVSFVVLDFAFIALIGNDRAPRGGLPARWFAQMGQSMVSVFHSGA